MLAFIVTQSLIDQLKQMITQFIHLTWFIGSELVADLKAKRKSSSPGTGLPTPALAYGSVPQSFKIAVIKPILKKPNMDPNPNKLQAYLKPPFLSKILEKAVTKQICSFL